VEPEVAAQIHAMQSGTLVAPEPVDEASMAEEVERGAGRRAPRGLTLLWVLLALAGAIYRTCTTPG
jgi:hypothetical protein